MYDPESLDPTATALQQGNRDPVSYVTELCNRIEQRDGEIRSFLTECNRRERVVDAAEQRKNEFQEVDERPPLYGVPVGVKDVIHVDGFPTKAGSALPPEVLEGPEAEVVSSLRDAGAIILGKNATTEFAGGAPALTRNPNNLDHTPGGSSSGPAAAVAAGLTPLALGTQSGASVIRPAAFCGIVGFKPTRGRMPTTGTIPRTPTTDHVALMTADIAGMERAASVTCSEWNPSPVTKPTLGIPAGEYLEQTTQRARSSFEIQVEQLEDAGYEIRRIDLFDDFQEVEAAYWDLSSAEFANVQRGWYDDYHMFYRKKVADRIEQGRDVSPERLTEVQEFTKALRELIEATMDERSVDLWISPAALGPAPEGITDTGSGSMNFPWTMAGLPVATVPVDRIDGLPIGLQCISGGEMDEQLLRWADDLADRARVPGKQVL